MYILIYIYIYIIYIYIYILYTYILQHVYSSVRIFPLPWHLRSPHFIFPILPRCQTAHQNAGHPKETNGSPRYIASGRWTLGCHGTIMGQSWENGKIMGKSWGNYWIAKNIKLF